MTTECDKYASMLRRISFTTSKTLLLKHIGQCVIHVMEKTDIPNE